MFNLSIGRGYVQPVNWEGRYSRYLYAQPVNREGICNQLVNGEEMCSTCQYGGDVVTYLFNLALGGDIFNLAARRGYIQPANRKEIYSTWKEGDLSLRIKPKN